MCYTGLGFVGGQNGLGSLMCEITVGQNIAAVLFAVKRNGEMQNDYKVYITPVRFLLLVKMERTGIS